MTASPGSPGSAHPRRQRIAPVARMAPLARRADKAATTAAQLAFELAQLARITQRRDLAKLATDALTLASDVHSVIATLDFPPPPAVTPVTGDAQDEGQVA